MQNLISNEVVIIFTKGKWFETYLIYQIMFWNQLSNNVQDAKLLTGIFHTSVPTFIANLLWLQTMSV